MKNKYISSLLPAAAEPQRSTEARLPEPSTQTVCPTAQDALQLVRDLHVHQIELESQNEALREVRAQLEQSLRRCTELYKTEAALWERERLFSALLQTVPAGVSITRQRVFQQANDCLYQMLGYSPAELIGQSSRLIYLSDAEFERVGWEKYHQAIGTGSGATETQWCCKDGRLIDVHLRFAAIAPQQPEVGFVFAALDISARKRMEITLRASEQRYRTLVELLPYGIQENDCEGRITFANPALERLHGHWEGGLVGRFLWDLLADSADRVQLRDYLQFLVRKQPTPKTYFAKNRRADGLIIEVQVDWTYYYHEHGQVQGFIAVITDITERRKTETRLAEHAEHLQQLSRRLFSVQEAERRRLARELHDDFGQQLAALKLNLATLSRQLCATENQHYVTDSLEIVTHTLERLRNVALDLRPSVLDDLGLAAALHGYARRQAERAGCKIAVWDQLSPLSSEIETAAFRIVQEAVNNAIRHGAAPIIVVIAEVCKQVLWLTIRDDGCGFDPLTIAASGHTGLGLSSMRERTELLNGRFRLASRPGRGVVIEVTIPVSEEVS